MEIFLVGGAVRDELLGRPVKERDWVVVGATPEQMLSQRYKPVGKDFPVFLHPQTKEEYALARTERKIGKGYKGFECYAAPDVTLEQDLMRRDLTINAMAKSKSGELIDPYGGRKDLEHKQLRHVSEAFIEDPVRILRVARFAARLPDFSVHADTCALMSRMVENQEVNALVPERVWRELVRALEARAPIRFFEVLKKCKALDVLFPEMKHFAVLGQPEVAQAGSMVCFSALLSTVSPETVKTVCKRLRCPNEYKEMALLVAYYLADYQHSLQFNHAQLLDCLHRLDAWRRPARFQKFLNICRILDRSGTPEATLRRLQHAWNITSQADTKALATQGLDGLAFAEALKAERLALLSKENV